jgi:hypothetical protein
MELDYSDIQYYREEDLQEVLERLLVEPNFFRMCRFMKPEISEEEAKEWVRSIKTLRDFQIDFVITLIEKLISIGITELTFDFEEELSRNHSDKYLFITNHRNIVMDSLVVNYSIFKALGNDFESTAMAIGNNLLTLPWVKDLARLNKCFVVIRDASVQQMLENSKKLSSYIRKLILEGESSVWIAQREGRTKDGNDSTQPGLLKMLQMSANDDFVQDFMDLRIVPVAISYELDPCLHDKIRELFSIESTGSFSKGPLDDFNSMYNGLIGNKGRVHLSYGKVIGSEVLCNIDKDIPKNDKIKKLAEHIDGFIHSHYKLWPNNYIAADLLNKTRQFSEFYDQDQLEIFDTMFQKSIDNLEGDPIVQRDIMLKMFANPVKNAYKENNKYSFIF